ncbi:MAG TPA: MMPL family transporter, partial [Opitutales bacterium]|nr:MMPL family transporter [Opitutales bacterium]
MFLLVALSLAIWSQARNGKVQSDIFSILRDSAASEDAALQRELMDRQGRILALMIEGPDAAEAAEEVARRLVSSGAVSGACVPGPEALAQAGKTVFDNRMTLLFPSFLAAERRTYDQEKPAERFDAWLARRSADRLDAFLQSPRSLALAGSVPEDPLLLSASFIDAIPEGFAGPGARVMAEISGPATDSAVQKAVLGSLSELKSELAAKGLVLHASGAVLFAQRSEVFIRADVTRLNVLMTLALGAILLAALRSIRSVLAAALPVVMGALAAAAALFLFEDGVYALALGIGGILGGIAIDYPLHILLHRHLEEPGYGPAARRLVRPLFLGCATTALAFLFLLFSDLPLMRQVGFLVGVGLFAVMLFVLPAFAAFAPKGDPEATAARLEAFSLPQTPVLRWGFVALLALLCAFAPGLRHGNDLDALQPPMPDLLRENDIVRGSGADASRLFVTFGSDLDGALAASPGPGTGDLSSPLSTSGETLA